MKMVSVKMDEKAIEGLDELVKEGRHNTRSSAIRAAIRDLLKQERIWSRI